MRNRLSASEYIAGVLGGNRFILSRAITLVESKRTQDAVLSEAVIAGIVAHTGGATRIGITGVPGVGKSTFIEAFGMHLVSQGKKVAVLAIDPTSPKTKGSIMADKTRMGMLSATGAAFIRPTPAGSSLGGVARKTRESMLLCEAAGYDVILIETVGVGQSEVAVRQMTDFFLLLMLAGAGDELQGIKKGVMEMADMVAITKADGDNLQKSEQAAAEYRAALHLYRAKASGWSPPVLICSALGDKNIDQIWAKIQEHGRVLAKSGWLEKNRRKQSKHWMAESIQEALMQDFYGAEVVKNGYNALVKLVEKGEISPYKAARELLLAYRKAKN